MVVDPETMPYLDIANQTGRSIRIPPSERKVSLVWMACPRWAAHWEFVLVPRSQELLRMKRSDFKFILGFLFHFVSFWYLNNNLGQASLLELFCLK